MDKIAVAIICTTLLGVVACTTPQQRGYVICNDLAANSNCPNSTSNVVVN